MRKQNVLFGLASLALLSSCGAPEIVDTAEVGSIRDAIAFHKTEIENYELRLGMLFLLGTERRGRNHFANRLGNIPSDGRTLISDSGAGHRFFFMRLRIRFN